MNKQKWILGVSDAKSHYTGGKSHSYKIYDAYVEPFSQYYTLFDFDSKEEASQCFRYINSMPYRFKLKETSDKENQEEILKSIDFDVFKKKIDWSYPITTQLFDLLNMTMKEQVMAGAYEGLTDLRVTLDNRVHYSFRPKEMLFDASKNMQYSLQTALYQEIGGASIGIPERAYPIGGEQEKHAIASNNDFQNFMKTDFAKIADFSSIGLLSIDLMARTIQYENIFAECTSVKDLNALLLSKFSNAIPYYL